jgi:predicted CXXCH cytochrome family protein
MKSLAVIVLVLLSLSLAGHDALACNVCHSKNPKMVRMHEALGFKDCFKCHGPGKGGGDSRARMASDPLCINCHRK